MQQRQRECSRNKKLRSITRRERLERLKPQQLLVLLRRTWTCSCRILKKSQNYVSSSIFIRMRISSRSWSPRLEVWLLKIKIRNQSKLQKEKLKKGKKAPKLQWKIVIKISLSRSQIWNRSRLMKGMMTAIGNLQKKTLHLFNWVNSSATWRSHVMMVIVMKRILKMRIMKKVKNTIDLLHNYYNILTRWFIIIYSTSES